MNTTTDATDDAITFPRDLAAQLHEKLGSGSWTALASQEADPDGTTRAAANRRDFELVRPLPSAPLLARMLDVAYIASLLEEEGRRIRGAFAFLGPEGAASLGFAAFRFASPAPFLPAKLAKLAPATDPGRTELGVWSDGADLVVWGLIHHGDQTFAIDVERKPTYLSTRILRAGTFTVHFDERLQLLFARDHGYFFEGRLDLLGTMRDRAGIQPEVAGALCRLARRMLAHGHGGTILVVDREAALRGLVLDPTLSPAAMPDPLLGDAVRLDEQARSDASRQGDEALPQQVHTRKILEKAHDEALDFVALLTAVDGAVVLDDRLGLLGAGATIQTPHHATPEEVIHEDPRRPGEEQRVPVAALGGSRHRSAVSFCAQQESLALALVASQDGDLSFFARRKDGLVHALRPYELGVGL